MPVDNKRVFAPEKILSPNLLKKDKEKPLLVNENELRHDNRKLDEIRPAILNLGLISQAKGSAYYEIGNTKIICSVYGPREVMRRKDFQINGQLYCEFKYAPYSCQTRQSYLPTAEEKDISKTIEEALESVVLLHKFPKSRVDIFIMVLENGGGVLAASLTCAGAALNHAGIEMYDLVVGCSLRQFGTYALVDPDIVEEELWDDEKQGHGRITLGVMPTYNQVVLHVQDGDLSSSVLSEAFTAVLKGCQRIYPFVKMSSQKEMLEEKNEES